MTYKIGEEGADPLLPAELGIANGASPQDGPQAAFRCCRITSKITRAGDVQRTEVSNGPHVIPPTHTETKIVASYGDASVPVQLTGDQSGLMVRATPGGKPAGFTGQ